MKEIANKIKILADEMGIFNTIRYCCTTMVYKMVVPLYKTYIQKIKHINEYKIVFCSEPDFADNSKIMYQYLRKQDEGRKIKFVWIISNTDSSSRIPDKDVCILKKSSKWHNGMPLSTLKEIATGKYLFFTHWSPVYEIGKRKGQVIINLWHGCGYKGAAIHSIPMKQRNYFDIALVPGPIFVKTKSKAWHCDEKYLIPIGYPRYDLLNDVSLETRSFADKLRMENKLVLWMPTFRVLEGNANAQYPETSVKRLFDLPILKNIGELEKLNETCKKHNVVVCIKRHPAQKMYQCETGMYSNIVFVNNEDLYQAGAELYALFQYTDALISDYSSVAFDYMLINKPIGYALDDFEDYKRTRGFVFENPLEYMPGHHLYSYCDLEGFIEDIASGRDKFVNKRKNLMAEIHNPCEHYCERIWKLVSKMGQNFDN